MNYAAAAAGGGGQKKKQGYVLFNYFTRVFVWVSTIANFVKTFHIVLVWYLI